MPRRRTSLLLLAAGVVAAAMLSGCGGDSDRDAGVTPSTAAAVPGGSGDDSDRDAGATSSSAATEAADRCSHQEGLFESRLGRLDIPAISGDELIRLNGAAAAHLAQPLLGPPALCTLEPLEEQLEVLRRADARFEASDITGGLDILEEMLSLPVEAMGPSAVLAAGPGERLVGAALASPRGEYYRKRAAGFVQAEQRHQQRGGLFENPYSAAAREAFEKYVDIDLESMDLDETMDAMADAAELGADGSLGDLQRRAAELANEELERQLREWVPCPEIEDAAAFDDAVAGLQQALTFAQLVGAQELPEARTGEVEAALRASLSCEDVFQFRMRAVLVNPDSGSRFVYDYSGAFKVDAASKALDGAGDGVFAGTAGVVSGDCRDSGEVSGSFDFEIGGSVVGETGEGELFVFAVSGTTTRIVTPGRDICEITDDDLRSTLEVQGMDWSAEFLGQLNVEVPERVDLGGGEFVVYANTFDVLDQGGGCLAIMVGSDLPGSLDHLCP